MDAPSKYTFVVATQEHPKNADLVSQVNAHVASYTHTRRHLKASEHNFVQSNFGQVKYAATKASPEKQLDKAELKAGSTGTLELSGRTKFRFANNQSFSKAVKKRKKAARAHDQDDASDRKEALIQPNHAHRGQDAFISTFTTTSPPRRRSDSDSQITAHVRNEQDRSPTEPNRNLWAHTLDDYKNPSSVESSMRVLDNDALSTTLDPFIRLPVEVTARDRSLLHFFLKEGRLLVLGTSTNDKYCIALNIASRWMQESSVFVLNHVVMAEAQLAGINKTPLSRQFYQRRSQVYSEVRHLMSSPNVSFSLKLIAVIQLVFMEWTLKLPELQSLHGQAVDALIESNGGLMSFLPALEEKHGKSIEPEFYVNIFVITEVPIKDQDSLELSRSRFIATLRRLSKWAQLFQKQKTQTSPDQKPQDLAFLTKFLQAPINDSLLSTEAPWPFVAAPFFACLNICLTFLDFDLTPEEMMDFLQRVQHHMIMTANPSAKGGAGIAFHLAHVRTNMLSPVSYKTSDKAKHAELQLSQGCVDALKIYSLLAGRLRLKLTRWLCKLCLIMIEDIEPEDVLDETMLKTLVSEITREWCSRQPLSRPHSVPSLPNS